MLACLGYVTNSSPKPNLCLIGSLFMKVILKKKKFLRGKVNRQQLTHMEWGQRHNITQLTPYKSR